MCPTEKETSEKNGHLGRAGRCWKLGLPSPTIRATRQRRLLRLVALLLLGEGFGQEMPFSFVYLCMCVFVYVCVCVFVCLCICAFVYLYLYLYKCCWGKFG